MTQKFSHVRGKATDKTDKTPSEEVSSVLSVHSGSIPENSAPSLAAGGVENNVVRLPLKRRSLWAAKHLQFIEGAHEHLFLHLAALGDEQFRLEHAELERLIRSTGMTPAVSFVLNAYSHEAANRPAGNDGEAAEP